MSSVAHAEAHQNDGDQKNQAQSEQQTAERFEEGKTNSHSLTDAKDERSIANKLEAAEKAEKAEKEAEDNKPRPTELAEAHGNKPSRGAVIDEKIEDEEAELIRKMDEAKAAKAAN